MEIARRTTTPFAAFEPYRMMREMLRWDPFRDLDTPSTTTQTDSFVPRFEVRETPEALELRADLPGLTDKDVEVSLSGNRLTVSGKREHEKRDEKANYLLVERSFGQFSRSFALPEGFDTAKTVAQMANGVLTLMVPKAAAAETRKITVNANGGSGNT